MNIEKMRSEFEASFMTELEVDLSGNRHTDGEGLECYQFDGDDHDERSKLASIAFMFWQQSRSSLEIELPQRLSFEMQGITVDPQGDLIEYCDTVAAIQSTGVKVK